MNLIHALLVMLPLFVGLPNLHASKSVICLSPDGASAAIFVPLREGAFEISSVKAGMLYSSADNAELKNEIVSDKQHILWSADSKMVAVAFGYPKLIHTQVFVRDGDKFVRVPLPTLADKYDNVWILPERWAENSVLHLKISGPHAGKADGYWFQGTATVKVKGTAPHECTKVSEKIETKDVEK